jgi:glycosyltransferase involved in cell wall biosynthesis
LLKRGYEFQLVFMGDGPDRNELEAYTSGLACVRFLGQVNNIADHIGALDLFAFPSRHEGLGSVLIDVMAAGVPIVATDVGGIPDLVVHNESGYLVRPNNLKELLEGITKIMEEPVWAANISRAALQSANRLSPEYMVDRYCQAYTHIF